MTEQKITIEELGRRVKGKYPEYQNYSDVEIGQRMLNKYPVYKKYIIETEKPEGRIEPKRMSFLKSSVEKPLYQKVAEPIAKFGMAVIPGLKPIAKGIRLAIFKHFTPEGRELEKKITEGTATPEEQKAYQELYLKEAPTSKEIIGSAGKLGLFTATSGAKFAFPFLKSVKTLPTLTKWAGLGGLYGIADAIEKMPEKDEKNFIIKKAAQGALTSTFFASLLGGIGRLSEGVVNTFSNAIARYSKNPEKARSFFAKRSLLGSGKKIEKEISNELKKYENMIGNELKASKERILMKEVLNKAVENKSKLLGVGKRFMEKETALKEFNNALKKVDPSLRISLRHKPTYEELNWIRRQIDKKLTDRSFRKSLTELPNVKENLMILRHAIQDIIKSKFPETKSIFDEYSMAVSAKQAINNLLERAEKGHFLNLPDIISGTLIGAPWFFLHKPEMAITTAFGAVALRNPIVQYNLKILPQMVSKIIGRPLTGAEVGIFQNLVNK
ncbi:hypothetical protein DRJ17_05540 [Candidatus Woesearchaeota archaeon]|nr:MAG: hypothetical protein DRJ17_05540 [Candidatus Woesearchaeota archaeon]